MTSEKKDTRRRYGEAMKAQVIAECEQPGASVAKVAMLHGINANVVHRWRQLVREGKAGMQAKAGEFMALPLSMPSALSAAPADIRIELRRGALEMSVTWPVSAAADFALWSRELLR